MSFLKYGYHYRKHVLLFTQLSLCHLHCLLSLLLFRSDGSYTYALYQGHANNDPFLLCFQVSSCDKNKIKILTFKQYLRQAKVPMLPVALVGSDVDVGYSEHDDFMRNKEVVAASNERESTLSHHQAESCVASNSSTNFDHSKSTGGLKNNRTDCNSRPQDVTTDEFKLWEIASNAASENARRLSRASLHDQEANSIDDEHDENEDESSESKLWNIANKAALGNARRLSRASVEEGISSSLCSTSNKSSPPKQPNIYTLGDRIPSKSMPKDPSLTERKLALIASRLQVNEMAFVKRSDKSWGYSQVKSKDVFSITFVLNGAGDTNMFELHNVGRYVRVLDEVIMESIAMSSVPVEIGHQVPLAGGKEEECRRHSRSSKRRSRGGSKARHGSIKTVPEADTLDNRSESEADTLDVRSRSAKLGGWARSGSDPPSVGVYAWRHEHSDELNPAPPMPRTMSENNLARTLHRSRRSLDKEGGEGEHEMNTLRQSSNYDELDSKPVPRTFSENDLKRTVRRRCSLDCGVARAEQSVVTIHHSSATLLPLEEEALGVVCDDRGPTPPFLQMNTDVNASLPVPQVQCKTEDGGTITVPMYKVGMDVYYKRNDNVESAKILEVHLDDFLEPYYTIKLEDGREKQTDNAHLTVELPCR